MTTVWVLTRCINAYEQDGEYFVAVFKDFPSYEQFSNVAEYDPGAMGVAEVYENLVNNNGGRMGREYEWFCIQEISL